MNAKFVCPCCSYPLLYQVKAGKLAWFCMHCHQTFPYGIDEHVSNQSSQSHQTIEAHWQRLKLITDQVRDRLDDDQMLQVIVRELGTMPAIMNCGAIVYDSDQQQWQTRYTYRALSTLEQRFTQFIAEAMEATRLLHFQRPFRLCPIAHSTHAPKQQLEILVAPIVTESVLPAIDQTIVGILWLSTVATYETGFSKTDIQFVEQVTTQYTIALRQNHLLQAAHSQVDQVAKLNQLRDSFLNTISHELRTPLANMKLGLTMLEIALNSDETQAHEQPEKVAYYLKLVQNACEQEIHLINDLLLLQQLEAGTYPLLPNVIPLQEWLGDIIQSFEVQAFKQHQHLQLQLDDPFPHLLCDLKLFDRVMRELLTNACKFTPDGGTITVTVQAVSGAIQIRIVNSGIEIPASELERVFDKFYRVPTQDPWQYSGTGLGLALSKALVTHLGGSINVTSTHHQVCFVVELPHTQNGHEVAERDRLMGYVAYYLSRGKTIVSPAHGALSFRGLVYDHWGYHQDFLGFWQQLQQRKDFGCLSLEKDAFSFSQFLDGNYTVSPCARCRLPIPSPAGKAYTTPNCALCDNQLLCNTASTSGSQTTSVPSITHVIAIGQLPPQAEALQQWFQLNGFAVSFVTHPNELTLASLPKAVELILLVEELSETQAKEWVQRLRYYTPLRQTPIIALSSKAGCGQAWMDGCLSLEDYLITPLNGDHLAHHLQQLTERSPVAGEPCWFPTYG